MDGGTGSAQDGLHREAVARALRLWRSAEELLAEPTCADDRATYERAVAEVLIQLRRCGSFPDLMERYAALVAGDPIAPEEPDPLQTVLESAAFWRRVRELVGEAVA